MGALDRMMGNEGSLDRMMSGERKRTTTTTQTRAALPLPSVSEEEKKPRPLERIGSAASGALKGYGAGFTNILGTMQDIDTKYREAKERMGDKSGTVSLGKEGYSVQIGGSKESDERAKAIQAAADKLQKSSAEDVEKAKQGLGGVGQFVVDLGVAGAQMAGDIALGAATGGGALVPMAARVFGGSAQEARQGGATFGQQLAYGAGSAALSVATEQIANTSKLMQKEFGKSTLANAVTKKFGDAKVVKAIGDAVGKMQQTAAGRAAINAISEGGEEFIEDIFQPVLQRATYNKDAEFDLGQALYDAAVGGALGMIGGVGEKTNLAETGMKNAPGVQKGATDAKSAEIVKELGLEPTKQVQTEGNGPKALGGYGTSNATQQTELRRAEKIANQFGAKFQAAALGNGADGEYKNGVITVDPNAKNPVKTVLVHELTHHMETSGLYEEFSNRILDYVAEDMGADLDALRRTMIDTYAGGGITLDEDGATREIVAKFAEEKMFQDESTIKRFLEKDRNLFEKVYDWLRDAVTRLTGTPEANFLLSAEKLYAKALAEAEARSGQAEGQYSFAGENAKGANKIALVHAQQMKADGANEARILKDTGWFVGADGKWRFEIDDSGMDTDTKGNLLRNPDVRRYNELFEKAYLYDNATEAELQELQILDKNLQGVRMTPVYLDEIVKHDKLFGAYPQLRNVKVRFETETGNTEGAYNNGFNEIVLRKGLKLEPEKLKSTLIHEIQHAIQNQEGFARGASPEYWAAKKGYADAPERSYLQKFKELTKEQQNQWTRYQELDRVLGELFLQEDKEAEYDRYETEQDELYARLYPEQWFLDMLDAERNKNDARSYYRELYMNTAGEIEARDTERRRKMTPEERRNTMPDTGNENTVFAENNGYAMSQSEQDSVKEQLREHQNELNRKEAVATISDNGWRGMSTGAFRKKIVDDLKKTGYRVENQDIGTIEFDEKLLNRSLNYIQTDAEAAAYQVLPQVLKRGIEISGHGDHKARGYETLTIAAPVILNGKRGNMAVVVMKTKGNRYKVHRILTPEGEAFELPEMANAESTSAGGITEAAKAAGAVTPTIDSASNNSITNVTENSKGEFANVENAYGPKLTELIAMPLKKGSEAAEINTEANRQEAPRMTDTDYTQQRRDLDELWETWEKQAAVTSEAPEKADPADLVSAEVEKESKGFGESVKDLGATLRRKWFDSADALSEIGKVTGDKALYPYFNMARASSNAAINMITTAQTNVKGETVGKSLNDIFEPIRAKGNDYYNLFQTYLFHRHNVDRMSRYSQENVNKAAAALRTFKTNNPELLMYEQYQLEQMAQDEWSDYNVEAKEYVRLLRELRKAENTKNKPVFGFGWGAEESRAEADKLLREHPEFEALAEDVYTYTRNLMQYRADSGLITEEQKKNIESIYPHYVPTFRWTEKTPLQMDERSVQIGSTIKQAKGGDGKLIPLHKALADQTMSVVREGSKNRFGQRLLSAERSKSEGAKKHLRHVEEAENGFSADTFDDVKEDFDKVTNTFTVRSDGKRYDITVSPDLYEGIKALTPEQLSDNKFLKGARRANDLFKKLCTSMSPTFMIRNPVKDLQDAGLYSKDAKEFAKQFPRAAKEISTNGEYWQRYKALGGTYTSFFDYETGNSGKRSKLAEKTVGRIETLNDAIEQAPRLAEFMATVEKAGGLENASMDTLMKAMHNAADVTVNFGRSGTIARTMNRYVPFFNAGMQGLSKNVRLFTETKGAKDWTKLVTKCVILGVVPRIANEMMFGDRDDWDEIKDEVKDQNYLFPIGDGKWLKIPKGRALSTFGMLGNAADAKMSGEEIDARYILSTAADNLAPANPLKNNIFAAAMDSDLFDPSSPGTTWYGGDIESQRLQNYAPEERYDAKTDELSKWLGKTLGLSPKKINYILDQYTGFAGDVILPMMTTAAETSPFVNAFVVNSTTNNRLSGDFYDKLDELTFAKNGKSATGADAVTYRWFSKQNSAVGEINAAIREIEADPTLSGSEKKELLEAQYKIRNAAEKSALDMLDQYADAAKFYYDASAEKEEDDRVDDAYLRANREVFGAEYALRVYNKNTYEKAQGLEKEGVDYEDFFDVYFTMRDESENLTGSAASNAKRNVIRNSGLSETNKVLLYQKLTATGNDRDDDIEACLNADIDFDTFLLAQNEYTTINEKGGKAKEKAANFAEWVDSQQLTTEQKNVLKDCFMYYTSIPAGGTRKKSSSTNSSTKAKALTKGSLAVKTSGPKLQTPKLALGLPRG